MQVHRFTLLFALLLAGRGHGEGGAELLCAFTDGAGTIRVFAKDGGLRVVAALTERHYAVEPDLKGLPEGARVVAARIIPFGPGFAVAIVARRDRTCTYHYLVAEGPDAAAQLSPALFTEDGEPYRIAELLNPDGDTLQIFFSRGLLDPRRAGAAPQLKVFADSCASVPSGLVGGKNRLVDMGPAK